MTEQPFPMLAAAADLSKIRYPVLGFPKIDGIRAVIHDGQALSRKLIALPNQFIQGFFSNAHYQGLDGELVIGRPTDPLCIKHSTSGVMSRDGVPDFTLYVFDRWNIGGSPYAERLRSAVVQCRSIGSKRVKALVAKTITCEDDLLEYEALQLDLGYEGIILRDPLAPYKHGRSTAREGGMLKLKRFSDSEALVIGIVEEQANGNEAQKDNLGRTKRSTAKAGKTGKGCAGALIVRDIHHGWEFEIGTGLTAADRSEWWSWHQAQGVEKQPRIVKYKYFPVGMQNRPRHPVFLSLRDSRDL